MEPGKVIFKGKTAKGAEITLRYPKADDVDEMLRYINTLSKERTFIRYQGEQVTREEEKKFVNGILNKLKRKIDVHLLAFSKNKLVGITSVALKEKNEKHVGIFGISVAKELRGQGLGKLLMEKILEEAEKNLEGLKIITLEVYENNDIATNMYTKFGFKKYGKLPKGITYRGKFIDQNLMHKEV